MDLRVTVLASPVEGLIDVRRAWIAMTNRMAFVAEPRPRHLEQEFVHGAVRIVAVQAVLAHRGMLPQIRAALLCVTAVAILVHRGLPQ